MRCVTVQHFGNDENYTFITEFKIKAGELLYVDTKYGMQVVRALTSDFEVLDTDVDTFFGFKPHKYVFAKYCGVCSYRNSFRCAIDTELPPGWISVTVDVPKNPCEVLVHTKLDTFFAIYENGIWKDSYTKDELSDIREWLNIDLGVEKRSQLYE